MAHSWDSFLISSWKRKLKSHESGKTSSRTPKKNEEISLGVGFALTSVMLWLGSFRQNSPTCQKFLAVMLSFHWSVCNFNSSLWHRWWHLSWFGVVHFYDMIFCRKAKCWDIWLLTDYTGTYITCPTWFNTDCVTLVSRDILLRVVPPLMKGR